MTIDLMPCDIIAEILRRLEWDDAIAFSHASVSVAKVWRSRLRMRLESALQPTSDRIHLNRASFAEARRSRLRMHIDQTHSSRAFIRAASQGMNDLISALLDYIGFGYSQSFTHMLNLDGALCSAVINGQSHTIDLLLRMGASLDGALCSAATDGHLQTVDMLLRRGAKVQAVTYSALYWAANKGHTSVVERLLRECPPEFHRGVSLRLLFTPPVHVEVDHSSGGSVRVSSIIVNDVVVHRSNFYTV